MKRYGLKTGVLGLTMHESKNGCWIPYDEQRERDIQTLIEYASLDSNVPLKEFIGIRIEAKVAAKRLQEKGDER